MTNYNKNIYCWSPFTGKVGTVQNVINNLYSVRKYSSFNSFLINVYGEWDEFLTVSELKGIKVKSLKFLRFIKNWKIKGYFKSRVAYSLIFIISSFQLINLLRKDKPDFFIAHLITSLPLLIFKLFNLKTKLILHIAGHPKLNFFRKLFWKYTSKKIFKVICPSQELKNIFLKDKIFDEKQLVIIEDSHLVVKKINILQKQKLEDDFFKKGEILISIGRLTKQKNYSFLIKNFKIISERYKNLKLLIIGDGENKYDIINLIESLNLTNNVKLIDYSSNIYKYLRKSKFYVSTSVWEGSSLAMIDAAYSGVLILCSDCPSGRKEFIGQDERGFLFKENNSKDFLKKFYLMYKVSDSERHIILVKAKKQTGKFTIFRSFKKLNKILF